MKNIDEMTADELELLAKQKREQENKPYKEGFLKCDLWEENPYWRWQMPDDTGFATPTEVQEMREDIKNSLFHCVLTKGTRFVCHKSFGSWDSWSDENNIVNHLSAEFADKFLKNIRDI